MRRRLLADEGEAAEHQRDSQQLAGVDERVRVGAREPGREADDDRAGADPQVRSHTPAADDRVERAADEEERPERVQRDRPEERVPAERCVGRRASVRRRCEHGLAHRREGHGDRRRGSRHDETAEQHVAPALRQEQPRRAGAEIRDRQNAAGEVVRAEEAGRPAAALRDGLAGRRDAEERETDRPEHLRAGASPQQQRRESTQR